MRRGEREQPHPRREAVPGAQARVRHRPEHVAAHARDRPAEPAAVGEQDAHVNRAGLHVCAEDLARGGGDLLGDGPHARDDRQGEAPGRQRATGDLGPHAVVDRRARQQALDDPVADPPLLQAVELHAAARRPPRRRSRRRPCSAAGAGTRARAARRSARGRRARPAPPGAEAAARAGRPARARARPPARGRPAGSRRRSSTAVRATSRPRRKLRASNGCSGWRTSTRSRAGRAGRRRRGRSGRRRRAAR